MAFANGAQHLATTKPCNYKTLPWNRRNEILIDLMP
jgi:hypothetical protein